MGITGLIPFLEKASSKVHLKDIRGSTVAVDTYCWLHKGAFGCAEKLARGEDTDQYMQYCMRYVELLLSYDIKPILVFDGRHLPAKELTERRRRESRKQSRKLAAELLRAGDKEGARTHMRRCVDVTHEMALRVIRECRLRNVDCIVAPYEADAQMAWLNKIDVAQYVITEDSDLTLFGASRIIFKLDLTGAGLLVEADKLYLAMGCTKERYNFDKFRRMCILSGCDYLDSLPGIGLAKACKFMLKTEQDDMWKALKKLPTYLNMKNLQVDDEYIEQFLKAEATFKHMYIYNPFARRMERLHDLSEFETDERFCSNAGTPLEDDEQALQLALGNLNPFTLKQLDNWHPDRNFGQAQANNNKIKRAKHKSIWQGNYQPRTSAPASTDAFKDVKCALHFRKVDFISKTIDEEITENARVEHAKPEEAEIFSMYQHEAGELIAPSAKRRRYSSESNDNGSDSCIEPETIQNPLPEVAHNTHNPFARPQFTTEASKSVSICENPSLLRVLSPKKALDQTSRGNGINLKSPKSSLDRLAERVTVKSRFFANNINEVHRSKKSVSRDLTAEINSIEKQSQQQEKARAILYDSPSPKKKCKLTLETNHAAFNEGTIKTNINKEEEECDSIELIEESKNVAKASVSSLDISHIEDSESKGSLESAITLSDDDDDVGGGFERTIMQTKTSRSSINLFKSQEKQRLGLSRTKAKSTLKSQKASGKSNPKSISTTASLQNQTRLTMFGFKKRPTLK
ncbi:PREDICTED: exonuclease 1 isoform X1 [Rhagoletis zephyria]|uniref:exonuclease 1 isoform X1 n=1 Tax=Rhagoletis zephyria TaxID=28612 RepID=UPI0008116962|nr:PREDICTED: exonuclease 1 isoform X1 [Rhagoletis zephyria]